MVVRPGDGVYPLKNRATAFIQSLRTKYNLKDKVTSISHYDFTSLKAIYTRLRASRKIPCQPAVFWVCCKQNPEFSRFHNRK